MTYKSQLELSFQPSAFQQQHTSDTDEKRSNGPIRLNYIGNDYSKPPQRSKPLSTTLRFFLQLLRASLHGIAQCTTSIADLLALVSEGWDTATAVAEAERRMSIETCTAAQILSDERLAIDAEILLTQVRSKVRVTFEIAAFVALADLRLHCSVRTYVTVVYGEQYNEKNMTEFMKGLISEDSLKGWDEAIRDITGKLIARGAKGVRK